MRSIRGYLLTRLVGGAAAVLALSGAAVYLVATRSLEAQFDRNLADRVQGLASLLFQVEDHVEFEFSGELMPEYERDQAPDYFHLRFDGGRLLERSESLRGADLPIPREGGAEPVFWTAPLPDGRPGRHVDQLVEVHHVYPEEGPQRPEAARVRIAVARGLEPLAAARRALLLQCAAGAVALIAVLALLCWKAVARGLEPAERMAAALEAIRAEHLPQRLDVGALPAELQPVARTTDALLRRVDAALERERRTTADVAHELRTPLSELMALAQVALREESDAEQAREALRQVRDTVWRMSRSMTTLLKLARLEMGAERFERAPLDLEALLAELLPSLARLARERGVHVDARVDSGALVEADRDVLRIVLSNLLGNAVDYAPPGSAVELRLESAAPAWRLVVENDAPGLAPEDLQALARPFWRKDGARTDRDRSGLGLALSRGLARASGLQLDFELTSGRLRALLRDARAAPAAPPARRPSGVGSA